MRIGPAVHGALLVIALLLAYRAWTGEEEKEQKTGEYVVWSQSPESFQSLAFKSENKEVLIERRSDEAGKYLWGKVTRTRKKVVRPDPHQGLPKPDGAGDASKPDGGDDAKKPDGAKADDKDVKKIKLQPKKPDAAKKPEAARKPGAVKKTDAAGKTDGDKASQNDRIAQADPAKPKAAQPAKPKAAPPAKPKADPKKPAAPEPKKPAGVHPHPSSPHDAHGHGAAGAADEAADDAAAAEPAAATESTETTVREFPIGEAGDELVEGFSKLRALRELGTLTDDAKIEYGLDDATERLTVTFKGGGEKTLLVGDRVFGGSDRYVLEETSGKGYVLSSEIMRLVDAAETALGLKSYHAFDEVEDLRGLAVDAGGTTTELVRLDLEEEKGDEPSKRTTWARADSPRIEDVTMANFVDRVSKLRPVEYLPDLDPAGLTKLARFSYRDAGGKELGYMELYKGPGDEPASAGATPKDEYYMKTEVTRVLGRVSRLTAERVDQDLAEFLTQEGASDENQQETDEPADPPAPTE